MSFVLVGLFDYAWQSDCCLQTPGVDYVGTNRASSCIVEGQWANRAGSVITSGQWSGAHKERVVQGGSVRGLTLRLLLVRTRVIMHCIYMIICSDCCWFGSNDGGARES